MKKLRFSIAGLMILVVLSSLGLAAMKNPTALWASALFSLAVVIFSTSALGVFFDRRSNRSSWAGIALFGWVYLVIAFGFVADSNGVTAPPFITLILSDYMGIQRTAKTPVQFVNTFPHGEPIIDWNSGVAKGNSTGTGPATGPILDRRNERRVCHSLGAMFFALLGAIAGCIFAARNQEPGRT
jgi:hypothetical protein